jgi:hypothetical protein
MYSPAGAASHNMGFCSRLGESPLQYLETFRAGAYPGIILSVLVAQWGNRVFITNVKGTFLGMSESEEASKRR